LKIFLSFIYIQVIFEGSFFELKNLLNEANLLVSFEIIECLQSNIFKTYTVQILKKCSFGGRKFIRRWIILFHPPYLKIVLEFHAIAVFLILKMRNIKLYQICTHFQTKGVESQWKLTWSNPTENFKIYIRVDFWNLTIDIISVFLETSSTNLKSFQLFSVFNHTRSNFVFLKLLNWNTNVNLLLYKILVYKILRFVSPY